MKRVEVFGPESKDRQAILKGIEPALQDYPYDQYRKYPARDSRAWEGFLVARLTGLMKDPEWTFFLAGEPEKPNLMGCRVSGWDREHFGFGMASIHLFVGQNQAAIKQLLGECLGHIGKKDVRFISARLNGDNLAAIHEFQARGFQYYENIIWPVVKCRAIPRGPEVRLMEEKDLERVLRIAGTSSFARSHFHSDPGFTRESVDSMPVKWIRTSWEKGDPIAVIESGGKVAGYFAFMVDKQLSEAMGYKYARMKHLAVDADFRVRGLGKALFGGTIDLMSQMGADYVDSGYASKNHKSARLHVQYGFESVYEEVTLHHWL